MFDFIQTYGPYIACLILVASVVVLSRTNKKLYARIFDMEDDLFQHNIGFNEVVTGFEQDILTFQETVLNMTRTIESQKTDLQILFDATSRCHNTCLPHGIPETEAEVMDRMSLMFEKLTEVVDEKTDCFLTELSFVEPDLKPKNITLFDDFDDFDTEITSEKQMFEKLTEVVDETVLEGEGIPAPNTPNLIVLEE